MEQVEVLMGREMRMVVGVVAALAIAAVVLVAVALGTSGQAGDQGAPGDQGASDSAAPAGLPAAQMGGTAPQADDVIMTLGGSRDTYVLTGEEYLEAGCHAVDPDAQGAADITPSVEVSGDVDTTAPGEYRITYTATTENGERAIAERTVHVVDEFESGTAASIPVFMYHYVYDPAQPPADLNANWLSADDLEAHLQYLTENGYYYPSFQEIRAFAEGAHSLPARSAALTFDDGEYGVYTLGGALFREYQVPATMFLICENDDIPAKLVDLANPYISFQSHTYGMHKAGSNVGRGGLLHALSHDEIVADIQQAQQILGTTEAVAYPFGDNNETAWAALEEAGVQCAFTIENRRIVSGDEPMALPRVRISNGYGADSFAGVVAPDPQQ